MIEREILSCHPSIVEKTITWEAVAAMAIPNPSFQSNVLTGDENDLSSKILARVTLIPVTRNYIGAINITTIIIMLG